MSSQLSFHSISSLFSQWVKVFLLSNEEVERKRSNRTQTGVNKHVERSEGKRKVRSHTNERTKMQSKRTDSSFIPFSSLRTTSFSSLCLLLSTHSLIIFSISRVTSSHNIAISNPNPSEVHGDLSIIITWGMLEGDVVEIRQDNNWNLEWILDEVWDSCVCDGM